METCAVRGCFCRNKMLVEVGGVKFSISSNTLWNKIPMLKFAMLTLIF